MEEGMNEKLSPEQNPEGRSEPAGLFFLEAFIH
jgi:hypothetical protein